MRRRIGEKANRGEVEAIPAESDEGVILGLARARKSERVVERAAALCGRRPRVEEHRVDAGIHRRQEVAIGVHADVGLVGVPATLQLDEIDVDASDSNTSPIDHPASDCVG
jgi:hypothetical protein